MDLGIEGKLAVVTGSTAGIGFSIATELARQRAAVVINGRTMDSCEKAKAKLIAAVQPATPTLHLVPGDIGSAEGAAKFIADVRAIGKPVDILVNNMGIFGVGNFFEVSDEEWERYSQVNTMSGVRLSRAFMKDMLDRNEGRILFVSSECGVRPLPHMIPYSVSKATQINLARGLAELTKGTKVTVNSVLPGPTMTESVSVFIDEWAKKEGITSKDEAVATYFKTNEVRSLSLLQRFIDPQEIANVVAFLSSPRSAAINGAAQHVEGGLIRHIV